MALQQEVQRQAVDLRYEHAGTLGSCACGVWQSVHVHGRPVPVQARIPALARQLGSAPF